MVWEIKYKLSVHDKRIRQKSERRMITLQNNAWDTEWAEKGEHIDKLQLISKI